MEIRSTCVLNTFQQIYRSILPCAAAFYGIRGSSTRTNIRRICNNTFALIVYVSFMHRPLGHMLASCIYIRPRCTQRSCMQWRISFTSYFVREIHVKGLNSKFVNDSKHGRRDIRAECIHESNFPRRIAAEQFENATFLHRPLLKYCFFFLFLESGRAKWFQSFTNSYELFVWLFSSFSMRINWSRSNDRI